MKNRQSSFENIVGKEEIARNEKFLLFPQRYLLNQKIISPFVNIYDIISLFVAELEEPKIGLSGKGLTSVIKTQFQFHQPIQICLINRHQFKIGRRTVYSI